jgi:hypothetical protein
VIADPPVDAGAVQVRPICVLPAVAVSAVGAPGAVDADAVGVGADTVTAIDPVAVLPNVSVTW